MALDDIGPLIIDFKLLLDPLSITFVLLISFITLIVKFYSCEYMGGDPNKVKFMAYLNMFAAAMITLVTAGNYIVMFLGWEAVGLASFLLINFWTTRNLANKAAIKAIIYNRVGDIFFLGGIALLISVFWYHRFPFN